MTSVLTGEIGPEFQRECRLSAARKVAEMLTTVDQLESVPQFKLQTSKKKAALEVKLIHINDHDLC